MIAKMNNLKCVILCFLVMTTVFTNHANAEQSYYDVSEHIVDISNGSDEILGEGVPIIHGQNPDVRFNSGGVDHTQQYIVANTLLIVDNDFGSSIMNTPDYADTLMISSDWPDKLGNETDFGTFSSHFYDPDTEKNWMSLIMLRI